MAQHVRKPVPRAREAIAMQPLGFRLGAKVLGNGAYAEVREATVPCAAKTLHQVLEDSVHPRNRSCFERECRILGECFHLNIVRFFGVSLHPETGRPVLLTELMDETLTRFLEVRCKDEAALPYCVQLNISHDIAHGVKYLHSKNILHRDLSSNNVLMMKCGGGKECIAKISDFGMSVFYDARRDQLTACPGTAVYMPPEAIPPGESSTGYKKMDSFQMGVLMLQIVTKKYPAPSERMKQIPNTHSDTYNRVPEKERRENHLQILRHSDHPLLDHPILDCLEDKEEKRPTPNEVYERLKTLRTDTRYLRSCEEERITPRVQSGTPGPEENGPGDGDERVKFLQDENEQLRGQQRQEREKYEGLKREKLRLERHLEQVQSGGGMERIAQLQQEKRQLQKQLIETGDRGRELEHTLQRDNQHLHRQIGERQRELQAANDEQLRLRYQNSELMQRVEENQREFTGLTQQVHMAQHQLQTKAREHQALINSMREKETAITQFENTISTLRQQLKEKRDELERVIPNHTCRIVKGDKTSLTANHPASVDLELCDADNNPRNVNQNTPLGAFLISNTGCDPIQCAISPLGRSFRASYELSDPGQYWLSIQYSNREIYRGAGLSVYPDPRQLVPRRCIQNLKNPRRATVNHKQEIFVCEWSGNTVSVYDIDKPGKAKRYLDGPIKPTGIALDSKDDVYVISEHMLQKFCGESNTVVGSIGRREEGEENDRFHFPSGVAVYENRVYVCDQKNGRIQVFDLNLNYVQTVVPGDGQLFNDPSDLTFDGQGRLYVTEYSASRIVVMAIGGQKLQVIGEGKNLKPESIHVVNDYLYMSDFNNMAMTVFHISGKYITSFGRRGHEEGAWLDPRGITSYEGKIYVCGGEDGFIHTLETV